MSVEGLQRRYGIAIADLARLAGVSSMSVSRAINGKPGVGDETRRRILRLAEEQGFTINGTARALKTGRSMTLGVISLSTTLHGPTAAWFGVEHAARARGYAVSVVTLDSLDEASLTKAMGDLSRVPVEAVVIISPLRTDAAALRSIEGTVPVVAIWAPSEAGVSFAAMDHVSAARAATEHLLELGHATVHHISGPTAWTGTEQRIAGWRQALTAAGAREPRIHEGDWSAASGARAMRAILESNEAITALFVANDQMALGAMSVCHEHGIRIPEQISVIGYDDVPDSEFYSPPLTTVRQNFDLIAERAVAKVMAAIEGTKPPADELVSLPMIIRASTGPAPTR